MGGWDAVGGCLGAGDTAGDRDVMGSWMVGMEGVVGLGGRDQGWWVLVVGT